MADTKKVYDDLIIINLYTWHNWNSDEFDLKDFRLGLARDLYHIQRENEPKFCFLD